MWFTGYGFAFVFIIWLAVVWLWYIVFVSWNFVGLQCFWFGFGVYIYDWGGVWVGIDWACMVLIWCWVFGLLIACVLWLISLFDCECVACVAFVLFWVVSGFDLLFWFAVRFWIALVLFLFVFIWLDCGFVCWFDCWVCLWLVEVGLGWWLIVLLMCSVICEVFVLLLINCLYVWLLFCLFSCVWILLIRFVCLINFAFCFDCWLFGLAVETVLG